MKALALIFLTLFTTTAVAENEVEYLSKLKQYVMNPAVRIDAGKGTGSGTVIASTNIGTEEAPIWNTYVLTNNHVIASALKKDSKDTINPVNAEFFQYQGSKVVGITAKTVDIISFDQKMDLALVRLQDTTTKVDGVATIAPEGTQLMLNEQVWAIGAGLGKYPFITTGMISYSDYMIDEYPYLFITSPIIFGNSGGSLYHKSETGYELIGVPSRVAALPTGVPIPHMGWAIQVETIRAFLRNNHCGFIVGDISFDQSATVCGQ